jgi:hypothetical protein
VTPLHEAMAIAWLIACLVVAAGLIARRRWARSGFFAAYIAFGVITIPMFIWWPAQFYHQWFAPGTQTVLDVLKFGIAIEVGWRTFRPFPAARSSALLITLIIIAATALAAAAVPEGAEWEVIIAKLFPRVMAGTIWLMAVTLVLARWYRVPVHPFHAAILTSFVAYLGVSSAIYWLSVGAGGAFVAHAHVLNAIDMGAEVVMRFYWVRAAWQPDSATVIAHGEILRRLQTSTALHGSAL